MSDPIVQAQQAWNQGRAGESERILEASLDSGSEADRANRLLALTELYSAQYKLLRVEEYASRLLETAPYRIRGSVMLLDNAARLGDKSLLAERCRSLYRDHASLSPPEFSAWVDYLVRSGCLEESRVLVDELEKKSGKKLPLIRSAIEIEERNHEAVVDLLTEAVLAKKPAMNYLKGQALDRLGRYDEAFQHFRLGAEFRKSRLNRTDTDLASGYERLLDSGAFSEKRREPGKPGDEQRIAFLFGFPRSGTTLLENVLDTQANITVMPERPVLFFVKRAIVGDLGKRFPEDLASLGRKELDHLRAAYFDKARDMGFEVTANTLLVDKGPHHTVDLPLILMLFPRARLVFSRRHPLDACLSCFQTDFEINPNTRWLITLDDIVHRHGRVHDLYERYVEVLEIDPFEMRYEDLVENFEERMEQLFLYLGITPDESFRDFSSHAATKYVQSSSRGQTNRPLYRSAIGRWKNYRHYLEPHIPRLEKSIGKPGYSI